MRRIIDFFKQLKRKREAKRIAAAQVEKERYQKKDNESRRMTFELKRIEYREGREEWGAEKGKKYLVEVLGRRTTLDGTKLLEE